MTDSATRPIQDNIISREQAYAELHRFGLEIGTQLEMPALLPLILSRAMALLNVDGGGSIYLYEAAAGHLRMVEGSGIAEKFKGTTHKPGTGLIGQVYREQKTKVIDDYRNWNERSGLMNDTAVNSLLAVPLIWEESLAGTLIFLSIQKAFFTSEHVWLAEQIAAQSAIAISNALLYQTSRQRAEEFNILSHVATELLIATEIRQIFYLIAREAIAQTNARDVYLYLYDQLSNKLSEGVRIDQAGVMSEVAGLPRENGVTMTIARTGESKTIVDPANNPLLAGVTDVYEFDFHTLFGMPIKRDDEVIGVFNIAFEKSPRPSDIHFLELLAMQAGIAITNIRLSEALRDTAAAINSTLDLHEVLDRILINIADVVPYDAANIMLIEGGIARAVGSRGYVERGLEARLLAIRYRVEEMENLKKMVDTGMPLVITDTIRDSHWRRSPVSEWIQSHVAAPIRLGNEVIGFVNLDSSMVNFFTPVHARRLQTFTDQTAIAIQNARLYEASQRRAEQFNALSNVAFELLSSADMKHTLRAIARETIEQVGAADVHIYLYDRAEDVLTFGTSLFAVTGDIDRQFAPPRTDGLTATVARTGESIILSGEVEHPLFPHHIDERDWFAHTIAGIPLKYDDETIGVFNVFFDHEVGEERLHFLNLIASQAAVAIRNSRLYEAERISHARADSLLKTALALSATLSLQEVLDLILFQARDVVEYATAAIIIFQSDMPLMVALSGYRSEEAYLVRKQLIATMHTDKMLEQIRETGLPLIVPDVRQYPGWTLFPSGEHIRGWMGVPLLFRDQMLGVLTFDSDRVGAYTGEDIENAWALSVHAALAINNARLYEQMRLAQERFRDIAFSTSDWLWEVDRSGKITYCSKQIVEALGYTVEELIGQYIFQFAPEGERANFISVMQRPDSQEHVFELESIFHKKSGGEVLLRITGTPVFDTEDVMIGYRGAARDITSQREAEQREKIAFELGRELVSVLSEKELMEIVARRIQEMFGYYFVHLAIYDPQKRELQLSAALSDTGETLEDVEISISIDATPSLVAEAARTMQPVISNDVRKDPHFLPHEKMADTRAEVVCPLFRGDELLGVLNVEAREVNHFSDADLRMLQNLAAQISIAIENARLYKALEDQASHLEQLVMDRTEEIARERERLTAIVNNAGEGILFTTLDGTIEYANPAWEQLTGYQLDEVAGSKMAEVFEIEGTEVHAQLVKAIVQQDTTWQGELQPRRPDGSRYVAGITVAPVHDAEGETVYLVGVMHDITAQKEVDRMRKQFIANVSHELRTPITTIKLYQTLLRTGSPEKREEYLETMIGQVSRLERLVEDLLDLSRLDRGMMAMVPRYFGLNELIDEVIRAHKLQAGERGLSLLIELADGLPQIFADRDRIMQVVVNLVANAINYTSNKGDQIGIRTRLESDDETFVVMEVWDTGVGIAPEDLPFIFNRFFRAETAKVTETPGTGLGLAIVREIVETHGGTIRAESAVEKGSTFTVSLPVAGPEVKPPA